MAWVYILECCDHSYYVGSTIDLPARILQHELGLGATYTARRRPVRLVWAMEFDSVVDAFAFEKQVQNWSRAKREALVEGRLADLPAHAGERATCRARQNWRHRLVMLSTDRSQACCSTTWVGSLRISPGLD